MSRPGLAAVGQLRRSAEHDRPHADELGLVDVSVVVLVERANELACLCLVAAQRLADDTHQFIGTQQSVLVSVQRVEATTDILVATPYVKHDTGVC